MSSFQETSNDSVLLRKVIGQIILAAVAFVLTAGIWEFVAGRLNARPVVPEPFKTKLDLFLNGPNYDTVFVGSSRIFHGIDPTVFDAETARRKTPTHAYNLGFDALDFPEMRYLVLTVLGDPRTHLKQMFIEASMRVRLAPGLEHSQRAVTLHDEKGSGYIAQFIINGNHDWPRKLYWLLEQGSVSAVRLSNVGVLTNRYVRPQEPPVDLSEVAGTGANGFEPLTHQTANAPHVTIAGIQQLVAEQKRDELDGEGRRLNDYEVAQLVELQALAASHGVKLFVLSAPTATSEMFGEFSAFKIAQQSGHLTVPFLWFTDPVAYFDLYDPSGFVDPDHINQAVASRWSMHVADAFADVQGEHR